MDLSFRQKFRTGNPGWEDYVRFVELPQLKEVRTVDPALNPILERIWLHEWDSKLIPTNFPHPKDDTTYLQLAVEIESFEEAAVNEGLHLLGYDLVEKGAVIGTSSLLNCGPWKGLLTPLDLKRNEFGLLTRADAETAKSLLPRDWGIEEHHAHVSVIGVYQWNG